MTLPDHSDSVKERRDSLQSEAEKKAREELQKHEKHEADAYRHHQEMMKEKGTSVRNTNEDRQLHANENIDLLEKNANEKMKKDQQRMAERMSNAEKLHQEQLERVKHHESRKN